MGYIGPKRHFSQAYCAKDLCLHLKQAREASGLSLTQWAALFQAPACALRRLEEGHPDKLLLSDLARLLPLLPPL